jgi:hypothetical protein
MLDVLPHESRQEAETNPQHEYANGKSKYICLYIIAFVHTIG